MKPSRLYIQNFACYDNAYIDFNQFSSALIVGKSEVVSGESNGVGKTTLFKAIEYVLFNHSDVVLEQVVRDDTDKCNVTFDFIVDNQEYRIARTRTRKGTTDCSLYKRTAVDGTETDTLHFIEDDHYFPVEINKDNQYWKDISGRRAADTDKELSKLIKVNLKSFRIFVHFIQHDFNGLSTVSPEKRKSILRDALNLVVYSKLEKIAKEKSSSLSRESDKFKTLINSLGDPDSVISDLKSKLLEIDQNILDSQLKLSDYQNISSQINSKIEKLSKDYSNLESKFSNLVTRQKVISSEKVRTEISIKEYNTKKSNLFSSAKDILSEIKSLEGTQIELAKIDFNKIDILSEQIISNKEKIAQLSLTINNDMLRIDKLKKPLPMNSECEECRQPITIEHRTSCQGKIDQELLEKQNDIKTCKKSINDLTSQNTIHQQTINQLILSKQHLESINNKIAIKKKELIDKRAIYDEYSVLLDKFSLELDDKNQELNVISQELQKSSFDEAKDLEKKIQEERLEYKSLENKISVSNKEITHFTSGKAVLQHDLSNKEQEKKKKTEYLSLLKEIESKLDLYPTVIQAYSNMGIPNLIIQNVLDDLQLEANTLLTQLKPGLQLSFVVEKTVEKTGDQADTLDINYTVNGRKRYYENISGAMQMAVNFSLKLGLSFLLQKINGVDIKFLLFDEITQSFDPSRVDLFMDIVKFFQKDYTILVVTHDDRLKDKFSHAILVEQDINAVSKAKVVSSW